MRPILAFLSLSLSCALAAEPEFPLTADSKPQANVPKGTLIKDTYHAGEDSVFPGTQREYQIYLPAGHDHGQPAAFMVFQDGVIYQAPVVFDNLIARKDIPPLVGIFIKPGVVPAANDNALPRYNRSHEYDSITDTYSKFLIDEFLPAIEQKHRLKLSQDPNRAAISGNSSGGICAFMAAWHRPDRFRRVFTGVGTYVGIHGADQLAVWVRKHEPKPLRVFLQSGTGDNNLYCGDWWMANQTMERSLAWAGYEVNHAWGEGGHNGKHATQIFPDVLRWLWQDWQTSIEVKANAKAEGKWRGYEVIGAGEWSEVALPKTGRLQEEHLQVRHVAGAGDGTVYAASESSPDLWAVPAGGEAKPCPKPAGLRGFLDLAVSAKGLPVVLGQGPEGWRYAREVDAEGKSPPTARLSKVHAFALRSGGGAIFTSGDSTEIPGPFSPGDSTSIWITSALVPPEDDQPKPRAPGLATPVAFGSLCFSPDQTVVYACAKEGALLYSAHVTRRLVPLDPVGEKARGMEMDALEALQPYGDLESLKGQPLRVGGLCVDTNGWLYVATSLGIQVCDQAGRVNFIIPTPQPAYGVCLGGKDLSELFIACGDKIYKRPTKARGVISSQQAPIKPAAPKL